MKIVIHYFREILQTKERQACCFNLYRVKIKAVVVVVVFSGTNGALSKKHELTGKRFPSFNNEAKVQAYYK